MSGIANPRELVRGEIADDLPIQLQLFHPQPESDLDECRGVETLKTAPHSTAIPLVSFDDADFAAREHASEYLDPIISDEPAEFAMRGYPVEESDLASLEDQPHLLTVHP